MNTTNRAPCGDPACKLFNDRDPACLLIEYAILLHPDGGAIPLQREKRHTSAWKWLRTRPIDSADALREAKEDAEDRVYKYIGDWHVTVRRVELSQDEISQLQRGFNR